MIPPCFLALLLFSPSALAAQSQKFAPPSTSPYVATTNYTGQSNDTLPLQPVVPGKVFDRFIQIWLENTDFEVANQTAEFRALAEQGVLLDRYYALTHPSQPNYVAAVGGSFWGMADDDFYAVSAHVPTVVDLLESAHISWVSYQENMPSVGFAGFSYSSHNYLDPTAEKPYTFYARKHNPTIIYDSVASVPARVARHRNFNDFAADVNASAIPQWVFVTPNLVNDAHDTTIDFAGAWLNHWLVPLLSDTRFNDDRTLILLTFDETENYKVNNRVFSLLLGGALPERLRGTTDSTFYTHYSGLSSVQANWGLGSLGRGDTHLTMANVFSIVADAVGHANAHVVDMDIPLTNLTGTTPGPLNAHTALRTASYPPADAGAVGAGSGPVLLAPLHYDTNGVDGARFEYLAEQPGWLAGVPVESGATPYVLPFLFVATMGTAVVLARGRRVE